MASKKHRPEEAVAKLRQVDVLVSQGQAVAEAIRAIGVTEVTYCRWRREFGGLRRGGEIEGSGARTPAARSEVPSLGRWIRSGREIPSGVARMTAPLRWADLLLIRRHQAAAPRRPRTEARHQRQDRRS